jgi:hypothetical protein
MHWLCARSTWVFIYVIFIKLFIQICETIKWLQLFRLSGWKFVTFWWVIYSQIHRNVEMDWYAYGHGGSIFLTTYGHQVLIGRVLCFSVSGGDLNAFVCICKCCQLIMFVYTGCIVLKLKLWSLPIPPYPNNIWTTGVNRELNNTGNGWQQGDSPNTCR